MTKPTKKSFERKPSASGLSDPLNPNAVAATRFVNYIRLVDKTYQLNWHHRVIADKLQDVLERVERGESPRVIFLLPPRHGKSEEITTKFPSFVLGKHPEWPIIVGAYSSDLASEFGRKTRDLMQSDEYQCIFTTRLREDVQSIGRWMTTYPENGRYKNSKDGGYTATGVGGSITGKGGKIIITDDPFKNREEAESITYQDKVWSWWLSVMYTRMEGTGAQIIVMTHWHMNDLVGRLLEKQQEDEKSTVPHYDKWEVIKFPAIAVENELYRDEGEPLWPEKFPLPVLRNIENTLGPYEWQALYQQDPISSATQVFKDGYFKVMENDAAIRDKQDLHIRIYIDPAISQKKEACNTAIVPVAKLLSEPDWYIPDYIVGKMLPDEIINNGFVMVQRMAQQYPKATVDVYVETIAYQQVLMYLFKEEMRKRKFYFNVFEIKTTGDKTQRIKGLVPLCRAGSIHIQAWMKELLREAATFPKGKTVDILDAISFNLKVEDPTEAKDLPRKVEAPHEPSSEYEG